MGKSDQKAAKNQANQQMNQNNANAGAVNTELQDILGTAKTTSSGMLPGVTAGYADIQSTGGYDPTILGHINDTYTDFTKDGGISEGDATAMRNRSSEAAVSAYSTGSDAASRMRAATGGYGMSGAIESSLARKGSEAASRATTDVDASIAGMRQQGKMAGAAGLSDTQERMAGNKLAATGGLANVYGMNLNEVNATVDGILKNYQTQGTLNNQDMTILTNLANQPGIFDKIISTVGTLGGAAAGIMTGIGAVQPKAPKGSG